MTSRARSQAGSVDFPARRSSSGACDRCACDRGRRMPGRTGTVLNRRALKGGRTLCSGYDLHAKIGVDRAWNINCFENEWLGDK